jgi:hypothetical protein
MNYEPFFRRKYLLRYTSELSWPESYELLNNLLLSKWRGTTELINPHLEHPFIHPANGKKWYAQKYGSVYALCFVHKFKFS